MSGDASRPDGAGFWPLVALLLVAPAFMAGNAWILFRHGALPALAFSAVAMVPVALLWQASAPATSNPGWRGHVSTWSGSFASVAGAPSGLILYFCNFGGTNAGLGECFERFGLAQAALGVLAFAAALVAVLVNPSPEAPKKPRKNRGS